MMVKEMKMVEPVLVIAGNSDYTPFRPVDELKFLTFSTLLGASDDWENVFGLKKLDNKFFLELAKPAKWISSSHLQMIALMLWNRKGEVMKENRRIILDDTLTYELHRKYKEFIVAEDKECFPWEKLLIDIPNGAGINREPKLKWYKDLDCILVPMNWKSSHWVGLEIKFNDRCIQVYDPLIKSFREATVRKHMQPICEMLPYLIKAMCEDEVGVDFSLSPFQWKRVQGIAQNPRTGDCGPLAMKFLEVVGLQPNIKEIMKITVEGVDMLRKNYAMDIYEDGVRDFV